MSDENQDSASNSGQTESSSGESQSNPPLRDGTTYIEKGEKGGTTRES